MRMNTKNNNAKTKLSHCYKDKTEHCNNALTKHYKQYD